MRRSLLRHLSLSLAFILAGCGASSKPKQSTGRVEPASSGQGYDFRKEGTVPAPAGGSARPETDVEEIPVDEDTGIEVSDAEAPPDTARTPAPSASEATVDGFRIQIFASADRDVAQSALSVAAERLGVPAYLDLDGGVYKVRVGDYARREDADAALPGVRAQHYPDAWIVPARVKVPQR